MPKKENKKDWWWDEETWQKAKKAVGADKEEWGSFADFLRNTRRMAKGVATAGMVKGKRPPVKTKPKETIIGGPRSKLVKSKKRQQEYEKLTSKGLTETQIDNAMKLKGEAYRMYVEECVRKNKQKKGR